MKIRIKHLIFNVAHINKTVFLEKNLFTFLFSFKLRRVSYIEFWNQHKMLNSGFTTRKIRKMQNYNRKDKIN